MVNFMLEILCFFFFFYNISSVFTYNDVKSGVKRHHFPWSTDRQPINVNYNKNITKSNQTTGILVENKIAFLIH